MKNLYFFANALLFTCLLYPLTSRSQPDTPQEIIVTATRTAQTVDSSAAAVTVITRKEIEQSQAVTLPGLLRYQAGLDFNNSGGLGKATSIFMRGTESDHVLVLVDGIKIGSATVGSVAWQDLPLADVERIEIVRGPHSSLYGSEAIGGIIQIFTRKGKGKPHLELNGGLGSENTQQLGGGLLGATPKVWYSVHANHLQTDGFNVCQGNLNAGCFTIEPDEDGYENTSFSAKVGSQLGEQGNIEAYAWRTQGNNQYDSAWDNEADFLQQVIGIKTDYMASEHWLINLNVGNSLDEIDNFGHDVAKTYFDTKRTVATLQNNFQFTPEKLLTVGYDYQQDQVDSNTAYRIDSRDNQALFLQYQTQVGKTKWITGLRYDDNEQFNSHTTGSLGLSYRLSPQTRFIAAYGTAFKAPAFNELYYPDYGNPHLAPEESESIEMGFISTQQSPANWSLNFYHTRIEQLIASYFDTNTGRLFADNLNKAKITGMDSSVGWHNAGWDFNANFSWLKPEDEATGNLLARRAERTFNLELAQQQGAARLAIQWLAQSHRYEDAENTQRLAGYGIFNLNGEYTVNKHWLLKFRWENLLGKEYQTARFYNTPERAWFASLHYRQ